MSLKDRIWHKWLRRPYRLHRAVDQGPRRDAPVVLLHGLGRSADVWSDLVAELADKPVRVLAFDLLGFGRSPKPDLRYNLDEHARAVISSLEKVRLRQPVILVGHSMGCLISVRVARLRPDLVRHLILYEMPLYAGLPDKRSYRLRLKLYFNLYNRVIKYKPIFSGEGKRRAQRLVEKAAGFSLSDATWKPFVRSLKHAIMEQDVHKDFAEINVPMDVIYGTRDRLVIRGETKLIFGEDRSDLAAFNIREGHRISKKASDFLALRIDAAVTGQTRHEVRTGEPSEPSAAHADAVADNQHVKAKDKNQAESKRSTKTKVARKVV